MFFAHNLEAVELAFLAMLAQNLGPQKPDLSINLSNATSGCVSNFSPSIITLRSIIKSDLNTNEFIIPNHFVTQIR